MSRALSSVVETGTAVTLNQAKVGGEVQIRVLSGPGCDRLRELGLCENLKIRKISGGRNLICSVCGSRLAISRELAEHVLVSPLG